MHALTSPATLHQLAGFVAEHLTDYEVDPGLGVNEWSVVLAGPDQARLYFRLDKDRLIISGGYPQTEKRPEHFKIGVSRFKDPALIARDIARRLLPRYEPELVNVLVYNDQRADDAQEQAAVVARALEAAPSLSGSDSDLRWYPKGSGYGDVRVNHNGSTMELHLRSLPTDLALDVMRLVHERTQAAQS